VVLKHEAPSTFELVDQAVECSLAVRHAGGGHRDSEDGGTVVVLGSTGRNFGAGMTGGTAFVLDEEGAFEMRFNPQLVGIVRVREEDDIKQLQKMIGHHLELTNSRRASEVLNRWEHFLPLFYKVAPHPPEAEDELVIPERYQEIHRKGKFPTRALRNLLSKAQAS